MKFNQSSQLTEQQTCSPCPGSDKLFNWKHIKHQLTQGVREPPTAAKVCAPNRIT